MAILSTNKSLWKTEKSAGLASESVNVDRMMSTRSVGISWRPADGYRALQEVDP
jgi:hypothetical protein